MDGVVVSGLELFSSFCSVFVVPLDVGTTF
jgi:hypothetical protein